MSSARLPGNLCRLALCVGLIAGCASVGGGTPAESPYVSKTDSYRNVPGKGLVLVKTAIDSTNRDYSIVLARMNSSGDGLQLHEGKPITVQLRAGHTYQPDYGTSVVTEKNGAYHFLELPVGTYVIKNLREMVSRRDTHTSCLLENSVAFDVTEDGIAYVGDVLFEPAIKQKGSGLVVMTHIDGPAKIRAVTQDLDMAKRFLAYHPTFAEAEMVETGTREVSLPTEKNLFGKSRC